MTAFPIYFVRNVPWPKILGRVWPHAGMYVERRRARNPQAQNLRVEVSVFILGMPRDLLVTGKTTMLNRARVLAEKKGYRMAGLALSASAVQT